MTLLHAAAFDRYTVLSLIGKGSYGVVCAAKDNLTGELVAIKKIQVSDVGSPAESWRLQV